MSSVIRKESDEMGQIAVQPLTAVSISPALARVVNGLNVIGLPTHIVAEVGPGSFVPGVRMEKGELFVAPDARVSAVLHEAGHLATVPSRFRHYVGANWSAAIERMFSESENEAPDSPLYRALLQCSDPEATAWAYAFGVHMGLAPEEIILDDEYDGTGAFLRMQLGGRAYLGINGIACAGFCATSAASAKYRKLPLYPELAFWLQNA
jgi:hypothetical protein